MSSIAYRLGVVPVKMPAYCETVDEVAVAAVFSPSQVEAARVVLGRRGRAALEAVLQIATRTNITPDAAARQWVVQHSPTGGVTEWWGRATMGERMAHNNRSEYASYMESRNERYRALRREAGYEVATAWLMATRGRAPRRPR